MKKRHEIIQDLINEHRYKSYLEIGLGDAKGFKKIECEKNFGIDPDLSLVRDKENVFAITSDDFFEGDDSKWDCIFIDGLHHSEQVEKDIVNAYSRLNKGGVILIHDCNPPNKQCTLIPRIQKEWCGDVFRAVVGFWQLYRDKINTSLLPDPYGLFCIWKTGKYKVSEGFNDEYLSYEEFDKIRNDIFGG